jgi:hypothetical protein
MTAVAIQFLSLSLRNSALRGALTVVLHTLLREGLASVALKRAVAAVAMEALSLLASRSGVVGAVILQGGLAAVAIGLKTGLMTMGLLLKAGGTMAVVGTILLPQDLQSGMTAAADGIRSKVAVDLPRILFHLGGAEGIGLKLLKLLEGIRVSVVMVVNALARKPGCFLVILAFWMNS